MPYKDDKKDKNFEEPKEIKTPVKEIPQVGEKDLTSISESAVIKVSNDSWITEDKSFSNKD